MRTLYFIISLILFVRAQGQTQGSTDGFSDSIIQSDERYLITSELIDSINIPISRFSVNPITGQIARQGDKNYSEVIFIDDTKNSISDSRNRLNEFLGKNIFFDHYESNPIEGDITKLQYSFNGAELTLEDSLKGGFFSEGAGTWEWVIDNNGQPLGVLPMFDSKYFRNATSVFTSSFIENKLHLCIINTEVGDTLSFFQPREVSGRDHIEDLWYSNGHLFVRTSVPSFIYSYDLNGTLKWKIKAFHGEIFYSPIDKIILNSGYYFTEKPQIKNAKKSILTAHDLETGIRLWDIPIGQAYLGEYATEDRIRTSNIFQIDTGIFGLVFGGDKICVFDKNGRLIDMVVIPEIFNSYSILSETNGKFKLVTKQTTRSFTVKKSP